MTAIWRKCRIGELCELRNGRAFRPEDWGNRGLPIVRIQNLNDPRKPFNHFEGTYDEKHLVDTGGVLLSWSGTPGTSFGCFVWKRGRALVNQHIFIVKVNEQLMLPEFFVYGANSRLDEIIGLAHGAAGLRHITKAKLERIELPLPPICEQRRIISRIKECMKRVEEIESLRKSSRAEQQSLSASLIESELAFDAAEGNGWPCREIGELITVLRNGRSVSQDTNGRANGSVLTLTAVRSVSLGLGFKKAIEVGDSIAKQFAVAEGDVFVSRANTIELVGLSAVAMNKPGERLIYPDLLIKLKVDRARILPRYLAYALRSASARKQIKSRAFGSSQTMVKISGNRLREVRIAVPSLAEQERIIDRLDTAHGLIDQLAIELRWKEVELLRHSILRKAFSGGL